MPCFFPSFPEACRDGRATGWVLYRMNSCPWLPRFRARSSLCPPLGLLGGSFLEPSRWSYVRAPVAPLQPGCVGSGCRAPFLAYLDGGCEEQWGGLALCSSLDRERQAEQPPAPWRVCLPVASLYILPNGWWFSWGIVLEEKMPVDWNSSGFFRNNVTANV